MGERYKSADEFLAKLDAGELDGKLLEELNKLLPAQLAEVAQRVIDRNRKLRGDAKQERPN